jgi:hypothetical protein
LYLLEEIMTTNNILCVHRSPGQSAGLFYTCAAVNSADGSLTWGTPNAMFRSSISGAALAVFNSTVYCVYGTPEGVLQFTTWNATTNSWNADQQVGGNMSDSTPTLVVIGSGTSASLYCIHRGYSDISLYYTVTTDGTSWSADSPVGGIQSSGGAAAIVASSTLFVVYQDALSTNLLGSTFVPANPTAIPPTTAYWTTGYNLNSSTGNPLSSSMPALCNLGGTTYCVHRGDGNKKNGNQIWTCTLAVVADPGQTPLIQFPDGNVDISNQTYETQSGPAVVTDGTNMWVLYGTNNDAQNLYYAAWAAQNPWSSSYWSGEANAPDNYLWFEPAAVYVDSNTFTGCS